MTFSIRTFFVAIAIVAIWLGALVSKSPLLIEIVANLTGLMILLTLAWAIWERRPEQRAFWTGFFVLAFGNLVLSSYLSTYQRTGYQVASLFVGQPPQQMGYAPYGLQWFPAGTTNNVTLPAPLTNQTGTYSYTLSGAVGPSPDIQQQVEAIRTAVPMMASLLVGVVGGWLTLWIWRRRSDGLPNSNSSEAGSLGS
jgi:hypothetical protein